MQSNRCRDTEPQLRLRSLLHAMGLRYRVSVRPLPDLRWTADIVFRPSRAAVFVDGCFWHGCPEHGSQTRTNSDYWAPRLARNVERDKETNAALRAAGWKVIRVWEHEDAGEAAQRIYRALDVRRH